MPTLSSFRLPCCYAKQMLVAHPKHLLASPYKTATGNCSIQWPIDYKMRLINYFAVPLFNGYALVIHQERHYINGGNLFCINRLAYL